MEDLPRLENLTNEAVAHAQPVADDCRRANDEIKGKSRVNPSAYTGRLLGTCATVRHDHEKIDV